jgi:hypothetical protein
MKHYSKISKDDLEDYMQSMIESPHQLTIKAFVWNEETQELMVEWDI